MQTSVYPWQTLFFSPPSCLGDGAGAGVQAKAAFWLLGCPETFPVWDPLGEAERWKTRLCIGWAAVEAAGAAAAQKVNADLDGWEYLKQNCWSERLRCVPAPLGCLPGDSTASENDTTCHGNNCARGNYSVVPTWLSCVSVCHLGLRVAPAGRLDLKDHTSSWTPFTASNAPSATTCFSCS